MPFELDDLRWMDDAYRDAFYGLASAFGIDDHESFILSGCAVTITVNGNQDIYECSAGYIYYMGEILKVNNHTVSIANNPSTKMVIFDIDISYDPDGNENFEVGGPFDTYEVRNGILKAVNLVAPNPYMPYNAPTIHQVIVNKIIALGDSWKNVGSVGAQPFENNWNNSVGHEVVSYKKDAFGNVSIKGVAHNMSPTSVIFRLPVGYRPAFVRYFPCYLIDSMVIITIETDGTVKPPDDNNSQLIDLSLITFKI